MRRINRRIYATRRKRSPNKMFAPGGMTPDGRLPGGNNESFRGSGLVSEAVNSAKYMVDNAKPPYLGDEEEIGKGKRYTITKIDEEAV